MNPVIEVHNISKKYNIHPKGRSYKIIAEDIVLKIKSKFGQSPDRVQENFWALKKVSFTINKGEVVGIIGKNGSGKSTLLRILGNISVPTEGRVIIRGRVSSLLEAGPGFHLELTGRENIFLNGIILGIPRKVIYRHFGEILKFSGVDKFIDIPVKYYSTGMYVRLAVSIAAHLDPEILLLDEILSVGDAEFQQKSLEKVKELVQTKGSSVILVSHNLQHIKDFCQKVILLEKGIIKKIGKANAVVNYYLKESQKKNIATYLENRKRE